MSLMHGATTKFNTTIKYNQSTLYVQYVFPENRAVCEIMCKNMLERDRPQRAIL